MNLDIPNLLSPYSIENISEREGNIVSVSIRPKRHFFDQPLVTCKYDFRTRKVLCKDLNKKYTVLATLQPVDNEKYGAIAACLGLLCARKICLNFPYCYGEKKQMVIQEKMNVTLDKILTTRPPEIRINPYFVASILFQILWALEAANRIFEFQHNDLDLSYVGFVKVDQKKTNLILIFRAGSKTWQVPTFGYVVKVVPSVKSIFGGQEHARDLERLSRELLMRVKNSKGDLILDTSTPKKGRVSQLVLKILHSWQKGIITSCFQDFGQLFTPKTSIPKNSFSFVMPPRSVAAHEMGRSLVSDCLPTEPSFFAKKTK